MDKKNIFVLGSLNMDMVIHTPRLPEKGETIQGSNFMTNPGGKGANQAVACGKLGGNVHMIGTVGNDHLGKDLISSLKSYNINVDGVLISEKAPTGTAMIIIESSDNRIIINAGANNDQDIDFIIKYLSDHATKGDLLITQLEIPLDIILKVYEVASKIGMFIILNPAPAMELPREMFKYVDLLIPNEIEVKKLTGIKPKNKKSLDKIKKYFHNLGVDNILITLGENGSCYLTQNDVKFYKAFKTNVVDTTAAGDTFIGAIASKINNETTIEEAINFASKAASITISRLGAQQAIPTLDDLKEYI